MTKSRLDLVLELAEKLGDSGVKKLLDLLNSEDKKPTGPKDWKTTTRTCTKCGHTGFVDPDFGIRTKNHIEFAQGWCKNCRATSNYPRAPRTRKPS